MVLTADLAVAPRFALLIDRMCTAVAEQHNGGRFPPRTAPLAGPIILLIWQRLRRMALRFARLVVRFDAGTLPARRPARAPSAAASRAGASVEPHRNLLRGFAWLVRLVRPAACYGDELRLLLAEPEMVALLAAAPQVGRLLRPLCRMLAVVCPPSLLTAARPARACQMPDQPAPLRSESEPSEPGVGRPQTRAGRSTSRPASRPAWPRSTGRALKAGRFLPA